MLAIRLKEYVSSVGQVEIVCRFRSERSSRDRVSISPGDRLEFFGDQLRFEKSSPRWRIIEREEIGEIKRDWKSFLNSSGK